MTRVLVIGATGTVGSQVVVQLTEAGAKVRALTRHPDSHRLPSSIEVARGDLTVPDTLDSCMDDVDAVFLIWTAPAAAVAPALERITRRVRRVVYLSAPLKTAHPFFQKPNPGRNVGTEIERLIEASRVQWIFLRPGIFAANAVGWWAPRIRAGHTVRWPYLSVPTAPIHERDIAAVAARTLLEDGHTGAEYVLTGAESLTQYDQIDAIGQVIGRPIRIEEMSPDEARRESLGIPGMPLAVTNMLLDAWGAAVGQPAFVSSTFAEIAGTPPRTFRQWIADHSAEFAG